MSGYFIALKIYDRNCFCSYNVAYTTLQSHWRICFNIEDPTFFIFAKNEKSHEYYLFNILDFYVRVDLFSLSIIC